MIHELTGWGRAGGFLPYGDDWREHRRLFHEHFRVSAMPQYHSKQANAARKLLVLLLDSPQNFASHLR